MVTIQRLYLPTILFLLFYLALPSCRIEKHHYTGGFHLVKPPKKNEVETRKNPQLKVETIKPVETSQEDRETSSSNEILLAGVDSIIFFNNGKEQVTSSPQGRIDLNENQAAPTDTSFAQSSSVEKRLSRRVRLFSAFHYSSIVLVASSFILFFLFFIRLNPISFPLISYEYSYLVIILGCIAWGAAGFLSQKIKKDFRRIQGYDDLWERFRKMDKTNNYILFAALAWLSFLYGTRSIWAFF